jgi:hypothetical protein
VAAPPTLYGVSCRSCSSSCSRLCNLCCACARYNHTNKEMQAAAAARRHTRNASLHAAGPTLVTRAMLLNHALNCLVFLAPPCPDPPRKARPFQNLHISTRMTMQHKNTGSMQWAWAGNQCTCRAATCWSVRGSAGVSQHNTNNGSSCQGISITPSNP